MTIDEFRNFIGTVKYRPGYKIVFSDISDNIFYLEDPINKRFWVNTSFSTLDAHARDGTHTTISCRNPLTEEEIKAFTKETAQKYVYELCKSMEDHECGEWLMFGEERPFDPHKSENRTAEHLRLSQLAQRLTHLQAI